MATPPRGQGNAGVYGLVAALVLVLIGAAIFLFVLGNRDDPLPTPSPEPTLEPTPEPDSALLHQRLTVVLLGIDLSERREARDEPPDSDTIMLVSISSDQSELTLISLPRDTAEIPLPDGSTWDSKVNAIYREEGVDAVVEALETLFEIEIDGYMIINMDDFAALVDAVGGIEVEIDEPIHDTIVDLDLEPGTHELDGPGALAFVRTRHDDDFGRAERNQQALIALHERFLEREELDAEVILDALESFETDLPLGELPALVELARRAADASVTREVLGPPRFITDAGDPGDGRGYILIPDVEEIRSFVRDALAD